MYVAVKGGERAIDNAHAWLAEERRGDRGVAELSLAQIREQLKLAVNRVMAEGSLFDADLAALAIKQARGDLIEAIFLIRAYRTTLPRLGVSNPIDTAQMAIERRISATFKDLPGGQVLGPTFDYTHRLLDFKLAAEGDAPVTGSTAAPPSPIPSPPGGGEPPFSTVTRSHGTGKAPPSPPVGEGWGGGDPKGAGLATGVPHVTGLLNRDGLIQTEPRSDNTPPDLTREPLELPASRPLRLQAITRGDEGFILSMAYSTQRGYGRTHAFVGELRIGLVAVEMDIPELGFAIEIGEIEVTECETVNQFKGSKTEPPQFTRGYGLVFGQSERKSIAMSLVDRALRWKELGEDFTGAPAQDEEFVLYHADNIQATGFLEHIKLPHYVDFQAELELVRRLRAEAMQHQEAAE
jgi:alpha-D-ribose 1-methylphosphonate 5-triphosphate synthase subunit PhnI